MIAFFCIALIPTLAFAQCWYNNATCTASSVAGICANNTAACCPGGTLTAGLCPGPTGIQCCTAPTCTTPRGSGKCISTTDCKGTAVAGYCTGPASIQCCVSGPPSNDTYGVDVATLVSSSTWTCLKNDNNNWAIVRAFRSTGAIDPNACGSLNNARTAGLTYRDAYIFPCPTCSASGASQVETTVSNLKSCASTSWSGKLWLDIEGTQYWTTASANQAFFNSLVSGCKSTGITCGVYTSASQWTAIMGSTFSGGSSLPLWYPHYQSPPQPNFNDFSAFGGWTKPFAKQYAGDQTVCSTDVDLNWTPNTP